MFALLSAPLPGIHAAKKKDRPRQKRSRSAVARFLRGFYPPLSRPFKNSRPCLSRSASLRVSLGRPPEVTRPAGATLSPSESRSYLLSAGRLGDPLDFPFNRVPRSTTWGETTCLQDLYVSWRSMVRIPHVTP